MKTQTLQLPDMSRTASSLMAMQRGALVLPATKAESAIVQKLKARISDLQQRLDAMDAAEAARLETLKARAHRLAFLEDRTLHITDNTKAFGLPPAVTVTTPAVHLRQPLNPRTAIPMALPLLSVFRHWLSNRR